MSLYDARTYDRRKWFGLTLGGLVASSFARADDPGGDSPIKLILRGRDPLNAETPASAFTSYLTPNSHFFVRSHFGAPAISINPWTLHLFAQNGEEHVISREDLAGMDQVTVPAVLQCAGNGRGKFSPAIPGVGWDRGAVGNAEWSGVRLADLLDKKLGHLDEATRAEFRHVQFEGADLPPNPKTPAFHRSLPIARALDPSTMIATLMNGEPIPALHGGPFRLIVPGWTGNHWMKWLRTIRLAREESPGFYQQTGYRIPRDLSQPPATVKPEDLVPVTTMNVKSLIVTPAPGEAIKAGSAEIRGVAWTGEGRVERVEVAIDDQPWQPATFEGPNREGAWRLWRFAWDATSGKHRIRARATDTNGATQPEVMPWNKSGYLWNAIETVNLEVKSR